MACASVSVSAPGKLMILGEHAVVYGRLAMVCAVNRRVMVSITERSDRTVTVRSALGTYEGEMDAIHIQPPFQFVLAALKSCRKPESAGYDLCISSEFSDKIGFGSSAAVTVAVIAGLSVLNCGEMNADRVFNTGVNVIREVQGAGSGADVAASVYGGLIAYRAEPREVVKLDVIHPITVVYSGFKTPTPDVIRRVQERRTQHPKILDAIFDACERCSRAGVNAATDNRWLEFGRIMNMYHGLMDAIGVNNDQLNRIVYGMRECEHILGSKLSGSGLGDCIVGLGRIDPQQFSSETIPVQMTPEGVRVEPV